MSRMDFMNFNEFGQDSRRIFRKRSPAALELDSNPNDSRAKGKHILTCKLQAGAVTGAKDDIAIKESASESELSRLIIGSLHIVDSFIPQIFIEC